ncbi:hypothetical protein F4861DRAFT_294741 [Xylaria intraflava]|nr:hypothetical protein F4861DRAFT_294741 [Xylaria intraflava]
MDARPYRPSRHPPNLGTENRIPLHDRHKSTSNVANMSATGNFNVAAKRVALGDRNVSSRDVGGAPYDGKLADTQNHSTASAIATSRVQENRIQINPRNTSRKALLQSTARPAKTIAPSASSSQLGPVAHNTKGLRKAVSRATMSTFVYKDPQEHESDPAPAGLLKAAPEHWPVEAVRASQAQPSTSAQLQTKQERPIEPTSLALESQQPEQPQLHRLHPSSYSKHGGDHLENPTCYSTNPPHLISLSDAPPAGYHGADDDITESLYVDAVEELTQGHVQFLKNAPTRVTTASSRSPSPAGCPSADQSIPEYTKPVGTSSAQPEVKWIGCQSDATPPALIDDQPYLSDCNDDEDYYHGDQGYTTAHSHRSRGDNTTGGVTTIMFPPKLTKKGQAEIEAAKRIVNSRRSAEEIQEDAWDVSMVAEYGDDIFRYMKEQERNLLPNPHYMDLQNEIQWSMRSVLMDWVVQVHTRFGLLPETLFLTVNYVDRFLSYKAVSLGKLQLVGATAIFIAAKYEEINCPSVQEIVYMVDGGYSAEEILKAERFMLSMLDFELGWPGPMSFLRRISKADDYDLETRTLAKYFLEVVVMDERFVASPPSYIAAGAHCLSRLILHKGEWTVPHVHYSGYTYEQLKPLVTTLLECCRHARRHHGAVFEKYSDKRYSRASSYVEEEIIRGYRLPFEQHVSMSLPVSFFGDEATRASYAGSHAIKMPIPTHG